MYDPPEYPDDDFELELLCTNKERNMYNDSNEVNRQV